MVATESSLRESTAGHHVRFYEADDFIFDTVAEFFAAGLRAAQPAILICTPQHRDGVFQRLLQMDLDAQRAMNAGQLHWLDGEEMLSKFMVNGVPDEVLFRTHVGAAIEASRAGREHLLIRAFGEMVDMLLRDGQPEAALRLEKLWNDLGRDYGFALLCAYSIANLYREEHWRYFQKICGQHVKLPQSNIDAVAGARKNGRSAQHLPSVLIRDFALEKSLFSQQDLAHFQECDSCSELWWRLRQSIKASRR
jgi:hypothetical protein